MDFSLVDVKWCVEIIHKKGKGTGRHNHAFFHYIYVKDGSGRAVINGNEYSLSVGSFYIFNPLVYHEFYADEFLHLYELKFDVFDSELAKRLDGIDDVVEADTAVAEHIFSTLIKENDKSDDLCLQNKKNLLCELLIYLLRSCEKRESTERDPFLGVVKYINEHYAKDMTLDELSSIMHMEKTYFIKQFKKRFGITPKSYMIKVRMEKAASLIENSDMNISQIADAVGFKSIHHFSNAFKTYSHVSPAQHRENTFLHRENTIMYK